MDKKLRQLIDRGEKALEYWTKPLPPLTLENVIVDSEGHLVKVKETNMTSEAEHPRLNETQTDVNIENLAKKVAEMDKYLNTLGAENTDLKERVEKLEQLTNPEAGK